MLRATHSCVQPMLYYTPQNGIYIKHGYVIILAIHHRHRFMQIDIRNRTVRRSDLIYEMVAVVTADQVDPSALSVRVKC